LLRISHVNKTQLNTFAYKDKLREKARLEELAKPKTEWKPLTPEELEQKRKRLQAWSGKSEKQEERATRRDRKRKRREAERQARMAPEEKAREEEWKELLEKAKKQRLEKEKLEEEVEFFKGFE
jgi:ATP-dependent RNA helicase DDX55/SPB4